MLLYFATSLILVVIPNLLNKTTDAFPENSEII